MSWTSTSNTGATLYHCPCETPAASTSYHKLPSLYFCVDCDSIQCPECVLEEVSSYYCPNCLFEVPSASVRAEKNRCARNCFLCPCCSNTLAVVSSDPADPSIAANPISPQASMGEPPYFLSCLACKWDSKVVGITFDKPTGLAAQIQKVEEHSPAVTQYDSIREHLEPWLKAGVAAEQAAATLAATHAHHHNQSKSSASRHSAHRPTNAIAAAARALSHSNSTMSRNIPSSIASASRFNSLHNLAAMHRISSLRSGLSKADAREAANQVDELVNYKSKLKQKTTSLADFELNKVRESKTIQSVEEMAKIDQKWSVSSDQPLTMDKLHPLRVPLRSKKTKRCPTCRCILIKPDTKAGSTKYKMRVVASAYLPQIDVHRRVPPSLGSRLSAVGATSSGSAASSASRRGRVSTSGAGNAAPSAVETLIAIGSPQDVAEPLRPGRNFSFQLTFTNPLYEAVEVLVEVLDPGDEEEEAEDTASATGKDADKRMITGGDVSPTGIDDTPSARPQWNVSMPGPSFGINATAEEWEYEDEDDDDNNEAAGLDTDGVSRTRRKYGVGVLAKKGNKTVVQLDLAIGREAKSGDVRVPLYVTYTYTAEDALVSEAINKNKKKTVKAEEGDKMKNNVTSTDAPVLPPPPPEEDYATSNLKSFSFWASIHLGRIVPRTNVTGGGSSTLTVEHETARRVPSSSNLR